MPDSMACLDGPQPNQVNRSTQLCTCPIGPLWLEILNVVPLFFRLEEGQKLYPHAFKTERRIPVYDEDEPDLSPFHAHPIPWLGNQDAPGP